MVTPVWDHCPFRWPTPPYVMWLLVILNLIVFFVQVGGAPSKCMKSTISLGSILLH